MISVDQFYITNNHKITIMNIERTEFIAWMERIMERFDLLKEQMIKNQSRFIEVDGEQLLDNQDVLQLLKISSRSLQRYRTDKKLPYYTISGKLYYKLSDVHQLIRECLNS
ncbi:Helix-turn-helix domain-containing protein [Chryseobacterium vrystaatense]|uniref:Helix-turn-helix domain-containing protein n=2 Tax=Chryseobacterium group TaxID=2782232 RepID=A0A1M5GXZ8_9FLAO|nr:Helix-turn-helix domain-containing protein [Chryseobacterium vrystaatense]